MRNLAIIGASYLQLPLIEKAREMGFVTHVFAWAAGDVGEHIADQFYPISVVKAGEIADICRKIGICGVCSIASDLCAITVNHVANRLGLPGNSEACTRKSTNKILMRRALEINGDPVPKYFAVKSLSDTEKLDFHYPIIVKPTDRSGSRGICRLESLVTGDGSV